MIAGLLSKSGFQVVGSPEIADIVILNSCYVKHVTEQRLFSRIDELKKLGKKILVTGCAPEVVPEKLLDAGVSVVSTHHLTSVPAAVKKILEGKEVALLGRKKEAKLGLPRIRSNPVRGIIKISEGCTGKCSYCATKLAKGELVSYPLEDILREIRLSVSSGCREIWLTSQDTAAYGSDIGSSLIELMKGITEIPGRFLVRIGMMNPSHLVKILDGFCEVIKNEKFYRFLHLPVQSGSDRILEAMKREYTVADFEKCIETVRRVVQDITVWTDIIVGFPGETEEDFARSVELVKRVQPDYVNISRFAARPGTAAAKMKQLSSEVKKRRSVELSRVCLEISRKKNERYIGRTKEVLIVEEGLGRTKNYKPVRFSGGRPGCFVKVKIEKAGPKSLAGSLLP